MELAIPTVHWQEKDFVNIKTSIDAALKQIFGEVPPYKVKKIGLSASTWRLWVRLEVASTKLDYDPGV